MPENARRWIGDGFTQLRFAPADQGDAQNGCCLTERRMAELAIEGGEGGNVGAAQAVNGEDTIDQDKNFIGSRAGTGAKADDDVSFI